MYHGNNKHHRYADQATEQQLRLYQPALQAAAWDRIPGNRYALHYTEQHSCLQAGRRNTERML